MTKYIELDLNDPRAGLVAEVMANSNCKKIIGLLAEKEMGEGDLSKELKIPINTVEYNIKKLVNSGLIEKTKGFFWSSRGKKINTYKVVNKKIVISPKGSFKGFVPAVIASVLGAAGIKLYFDRYATRIISPVANDMQVLSRDGEAMASFSGSEMAGAIADKSGYISPEIWAWFLLGALFALLVYSLWNWRKK